MVAGPVANTGRVNDRTKFVNGLFPRLLAYIKDELLIVLGNR